VKYFIFNEAVSWYQETKILLWVSKCSAPMEIHLSSKYSNLWRKCNKTSAIYSCMFSDTKRKVINILSGFFMLKNQIVIGSVFGGFL
jgi:hypothetical protein